MDMDIKSPTDELKAERARNLAEHGDRNDEIGCFYRYSELFDVNKLTPFIRGEADRGVAYAAIIDAVANGLAYQLVAFALTTTEPRRAYLDLVAGMQVHAIAMLTGNSPVEVASRTSTGETFETVEGLFKAGERT